MKKIGILGSGTVGKILASGFLKHGYQVMIGSRDTSKLSDWLATAGEQAFTGSFEEAAKFGELIVLAVKGTAAESALDMAQAENINGKTIIDTTNPIGEKPPVNGVLNYFTDQNDSLMELLQRKYPKSNFVKAFNSVGSALMVNPVLESQPTMFICGNDAAAKKEVTLILDQFGWLTEDFGMVESARAIEALCMLWCIIGFQKNQWTHAFKLLHQ